MAGWVNLLNAAAEGVSGMTPDEVIRELDDEDQSRP